MGPELTAASVRSAVAGEFAELRAEINEVKAGQHEILKALTGNGLGVSHGLIGCVQKIEDQQQEQSRRLGCLENRWQRIQWTLIGVGLGSGLGGAGIATILVKAFGS